MIVELSKDEVQFILNLTDIAVRAQGINIAAPALAIATKMQMTLNQASQQGEMQ